MGTGGNSIVKAWSRLGWMRKSPHSKAKTEAVLVEHKALAVCREAAITHTRELQRAVLRSVAIMHARAARWWCVWPPPAPLRRPRRRSLATPAPPVVP